FFSSRRRHTRFSRDWSSDVCSSDLTAVCFGVAIFAVSASPREPAREGAAQPVAVPAQRTDLEVLAEAPGAVEPIRTVEVKSRASGEVLRVHVETGDRVEQGQLLAEIDPRDVQNALSQAIAVPAPADVHYHYS